MALLTYLLAIALVALVAFFFHLRRFRGIIERTGLPIVKPGLCLGSPPMIMKETYYGEWYLKKHQELGKTFGRYNGVTPSIVSIDPDFIREVTVKQFDNFTDVLDIEFSEGQTTLDVARYVLTNLTPFDSFIFSPFQGQHLEIFEEDADTNVYWRKNEDHDGTH